MRRLVFLASFAVAASFAPLSLAQAQDAGYRAVLAAPLDAPKREAVDGVLWRCSGDTCVAPRDGSRPLTVCARLARRLGQVVSFSTPSGTLAGDDLARCNAKR